MKQKSNPTPYAPLTGRGIHTKPNNGMTNDWITPKLVIDALGPFDLDPCACVHQPWPCAAKSAVARGLDIEWYGRVWLNPPYGSQLKAWIAKLADHGNGIALVPARTEVESWFWPFIWDLAAAVFFFRGRLYFHRPDGTTAGNAGHGSVLACYGDGNVRVVEKAWENGDIKGKLIQLEPKA